MELGSAFPLDEPMTMEIKGRHLIEGIPKTITISDTEIREALTETVNVTEAAPMLNTETAVRGDVTTKAEISELPPEAVNDFETLRVN